MKTVKQLGIWMDHSSASLMELKGDTVIQDRIVCEFTREEKELSLSKGERAMHNKEQSQQSAYYKKISDYIRNFGEVVLFGPTDAKNELANLLKTDHHFDEIRIEIKETMKMTESQMKDFVKEYFK